MRSIVRLILAIVSLVAIYSLSFMALMRYEGQAQNADPLTAIYWVTVTITTLGYGDIVFRSYAGRLFSILVALTGVSILWAVILPLVITPRLERLVRMVPSSAPLSMRNHIIISGYNPTVETMTERLHELKIPFLVIERSADIARSIYRRYPTLWGDPSGPDVLISASIRSARLMIANEKEELNADVILTAREISDIEVIALVDDLARSRFLSYAGASRIISPKTLLGTFIAQITSPPKRHVFPGAIQLFGELKLAELPIYPGSELIGQSLDADLITGTGASIVAIWQRGRFIPSPGRDAVIRANSILMAVGDIDHLSRIRDLTVGRRREGHLIVVGYGDVGRRVVRVLCESGIQPVIVDRRELPESGFRQVTGDGTLEATMVEAGIREAVGVLIMLNRDSDVIYSTLLAKNLNPEAFVVARANHVRSAEKIYRAGADYVGSVPLIASHMLAKIVQEEEEELALLYEDLELKRFAVARGSGMAGRSLEQIDLPGRFGCSVAAIDRGGQAITAIGPSLALEMGDVLAIIGGPGRIEAFSRAYERGLSFRR